MLKILRAYGIPEQIAKAIGLLYEETRAKVLSPDGETEYFKILAGVLQGDTLAPYLFAIVIDYVMRKAIGNRASDLGFTLHPKKSRRVHSVNITDLDFADDIALISEEIAEAQEMLNRVEIETLRIGLHLNEKKTEIMINEHDPELLEIRSRNGKKLKIVDNLP